MTPRQISRLLIKTQKEIEAALQKALPNNLPEVTIHIHSQHSSDYNASLIDALEKLGWRITNGETCMWIKPPDGNDRINIFGKLKK